MSLKIAIAAAALALFASPALVASPALAQMADLTGMDLNAVNDAWNRGQDEEMDQLTGTIVARNIMDPQVQAVIASGACGTGSAEQLAYVYAATGGCTQGGYETFNGVTEDIIQRDRQFYGALTGN